jgi:hypothetical protein
LIFEFLLYYYIQNRMEEDAKNEQPPKQGEGIEAHGHSSSASGVEARGEGVSSESKVLTLRPYGGSERMRSRGGTPLSIKKQEETQNLKILNPLTNEVIDSSKDIKSYRRIKRLVSTKKYADKLGTLINETKNTIEYNDSKSPYPDDIITYEQSREVKLIIINHKQVVRQYTTTKDVINIVDALKSMWLKATSIEEAKWISVMYTEDGENERVYAWRTFIISAYTMNSFVAKALNPKFMNKETTSSDAEIIHITPMVYPKHFNIKLWMPIIPAGGGKDDKVAKSIYYKAYSPPSKDNNCAFMAVKKAIVDKSRKRAATYRKECGITHSNPIPINEIPLLENTMSVNINVYEDYATIEQSLINNVTRVNVVYSSLYISTKKYEKTINLLLKDEHYYYITAFIDNKNITTAINKLAKASENELAKNPTHYVAYDMETIYDSKEFYKVKPYSISWTKYPINKSWNWTTQSDSVIKNTYFFTGNDCVGEFIKFIMNSRSDEKYIIIGFNNSRFDNYLLMMEAQRLDYPCGHMLYVNNSILTLKMKNHKIIDLNRFCIGSLKSNCDGFKTEPKKVDGFDHNLPQQAFNENKLPEWIEENIIKLTHYNKYDVISLISLTILFQNSLTDMGFPPFYDYLTLGQMGYEHTKNVYGKKEWLRDFPRPKTHEDDKYFRSCLTAGRVQCFKFGDIKTDKPIHALDFVSEYPNVMSTCYFPCGSYKYTTEYKEGFLGIYKIKYENTGSDVNILPFRCLSRPSALQDRVRLEAIELNTIKLPRDIRPPPRGAPQPLDWARKGEFEVGCTNLEIELCKKYNHSYTVIDGYYWENDTKEAFKKYIDPLIKEKSRQDALGEEDPLYSVSKRLTCKLAMNAVSGKVIQRNFTNYCNPILHSSIARGLEEKSIDGSIDYFKIGGKTYMTGKFQEEFSYKNSAKPSYLGVFIYSYARTHMYESLLIRCPNKLYMDTDSTTMEESDFKLMKQLNESDESFVMYKTKVVFRGILFNKGLKQLGQLEEEAPKESHRIITIAPKAYCIISNNIDSTKFRYKGVGKRDYIIENYQQYEKICKDLVDKVDMIPWTLILKKFTEDIPQTIRWYEKKLACIKLKKEWLESTHFPYKLSKMKLLTRGVSEEVLILKQKIEETTPRILTLVFKRSLIDGELDLQMFYRIKEP